jgi:N,N'-diacetyllegionaminate synthase
METHQPYIIGETAFHHEGDVGFALALVQQAQKLKLNAIKFHLLLDLDDYMIANHEAIDVLRPWCIEAKDWDRILTQTGTMDVILLCNDVKSIDYAIQSKHPIKAIEIHATGINDVFLLDRAAQFPNTVILGTGGSSLDEIDFAVNFLKNKGKKDVLLMHGFQSYPTQLEDIKLSRMKKLATLFDLPVGYADHTDPASPDVEFVSVLGVSNGFHILEKHFTHAFGEKRIDAQSAVSIGQLKRIIELANMVHKAYGEKDGLQLTTAEGKYGNTGPMKKAAVARLKIAKGEAISLENVAFKRTNNSSSLKQIELAKLLGNKANRAIEKDEIIDLNNVDFDFRQEDFSQFSNTKK